MNLNSKKLESIEDLVDFPPAAEYLDNMFGSPLTKSSLTVVPKENYVSSYARKYIRNSEMLRQTMMPSAFIRYWWNELLIKIRLRKSPQSMNTFETLLYALGENRESIKRIIAKQRKEVSKEIRDIMDQKRIPDEMYEGIRVFEALTSMIVNKEQAPDAQASLEAILAFVEDKTQHKMVNQVIYHNPYFYGGLLEKIEHVTVEGANNVLNMYFHVRVLDNNRSVLLGGFAEMGEHLFALDDNLAWFLNGCESITAAINRIDNVAVAIMEMHRNHNIAFDPESKTWRIMQLTPPKKEEMVEDTDKFTIKLDRTGWIKNYESGFITPMSRSNTPKKL